MKLKTGYRTWPEMIEARRKARVHQCFVILNSDHIKVEPEEKKVCKEIVRKYRKYKVTLKYFPELVESSIPNFQELPVKYDKI